MGKRVYRFTFYWQRHQLELSPQHHAYITNTFISCILQQTLELCSQHVTYVGHLEYIVKHKDVQNFDRIWKEMNKGSE
jgi:hypothetical protein